MRATIALCLACIWATSVASAQEALRREAAIEFEGNRVFSSQQLLDVANECLARYPQSQRQSPDALDYCLAKVRLFLAGQGYLRAVVDRAKTQESGDAKRVAVSVEEGMRYRLGKITVEGPKLFSPEDLLAMFDLKAGDVACSGAILDWLEVRVKKAYDDRGYIQYSYGVDPHFKPAPAEGEDGIVDFKVGIDEGRLFTVREIVFVGNQRTPDQALRRVLLLGEGDPFNQSLYEESINNLNRLGLFKEIDRYKDIAWKPVGKSARFDLIIHLKEKARP